MTTLLAREFPATTGALAGVRHAVREAALAAGCDAATAEDWVLAINEACMNIIQHAYRGTAGGVFRVELACDGETVRACLCDNGEPASLADLRPRALHELRPGGLGVHFMRELTDTMDYLPADANWRNRLQLSRRLACGETGKRDRG